jgi:hypothetical protein
MTFRERVEALPIRPIAHISHGANPSLKIHLLPKAGTDRNVRSSEYLAEPAVDQCIVGQCSLFLAFFKLFSRRSWSLSSRGQIAAKSRSKTERFHHVPSTEMAERSSLTESRRGTLLGALSARLRFLPDKLRCSGEHDPTSKRSIAI